MGPNHFFFFDIREHYEKLIFEILRNDGRMLLRMCNENRKKNRKGE